MTSPPEARFWKRLGTRLEQRGLARGLRSLVGQRQVLDEQFYEALEEQLLGADFGPRLVQELVARLRASVSGGKFTGGPQEAVVALADLCLERMHQGHRALDLQRRPACLLLVGVNGSGKTTTAAKLGYMLRVGGLQVLIAAADTYRVAAQEQLQLLALQAGVQITPAGPRADPGAVVFDALEHARARGIDVVIVDTAGRLQTHHNLMQELAKVRRVVARALGREANETLVVVDAMVGQNALLQASEFHRLMEATGIILTKVDGSAKGGAAVAAELHLGLPIKLVAAGEDLTDLQAFDPRAYISTILGLPVAG